MGRPPRIDRTILLETARAVFADKGFDGATLSDIATPLGVTPAAILRHAGSKQQLFHDAMQRSPVDVPDAIRMLVAADPAGDPRDVLRRFALSFVPFVRGVLQVDIALHLHHTAQRTSLVVPFDLASEDTPPRRGLPLVERYFAAAIKAGRIRRDVDPSAAARLFIGSLQSYVFIHDVLRLPPYPLEKYVDALVDLWSEGFITSAARKAAGSRSTPKSRPKRRK